MSSVDRKWSKIFLWSFKCSRNTKLNVFQYKLIHNFLPTNTFLKKIGIAQSDICRFCKIHPETVLHVFVECFCVTTLWNQLSNWLNNIVHLELYLTPEYIIFGNNYEKEVAAGEIILLVKSTIYSNLQKGIILSFETVKYIIFKYIKLLASSAIENNVYDDFLCKWKLFLDVSPDVLN